MRPSTVRRVVAGTVVVALVTLGAAALLATRGSDEPVWAGRDPLDVAVTTGTEIAVEPSPLPDPQMAVARVLGNDNPSFQTSKQDTTTVYTDGDLTVRVREGTPVNVSGVRAPVEGDLPSPEQALQVATAMLGSLGLDPNQWKAVQTDGVGFRAVTFGPKADLLIFSTREVEIPRVSVAVDKAGVRSFSASLARLTTRQVRVRSQADAFAEVDRAGRYESVRLVLVDRGQGVIRPNWEFKDSKGKLVPVDAVLTP